MDIDFLNDIKKHAHNFDQQIDLNDIEKCPKCDSIYIEDNECSSCHYQLDYDILGAPLGERSYYSLKENYLGSLSIFEKENMRLFKNEATHKRFLNKVKFRYNDLLDFFYSKESINHSQRTLFLHELRDVVLELMDSGVCEDEIWKPLNEMDLDFNIHAHSLFERIKEVTQEHRVLKKQKRSTSLLSYRFANTISISNLIMLLLFGVLLMSISLAFVSYQSVAG